MDSFLSWYGLPPSASLKGIPDHHREPIADDPAAVFPALQECFNRYSSQSISPQHWSKILFGGGLPSGTFIEVPDHHQEPFANDPMAEFPAAREIFTADTILTDSSKGLRSQKTDLNVTEIAETISGLYDFALIDENLAVYQAPIWVPMNAREACRFVENAVMSMFPEASRYLKPQQYKDIVSKIQNSTRTERWDTISAPNPRYLCCKDSMYDCETRSSIPFDSGFQRLNVLNCRAEDIGDRNSVYWADFLNDLTGGDTALRQRILEMIGIIITGYPSKSFFLLQGESGTGKSQLANFLRNLLGKDACFALNDISQLSGRWTTSSIYGKLLCLCGDMPDVPLSSKTIGTIKQLTGDDLIWGEAKYKNAVNFENTAKLLFVSNYPLQIPNPEREKALLERLIVIPCQNPVPREWQIMNLHQYLLEDAGYIIALALDALDEFKARNGIFTPISESCEEKCAQMPGHGRQIADFFANCCVFDDTANCPIGEVYRAFQSYFPESRLDITQFGKYLRRMYPEIKQSRTSKIRKYEGIRLNGCGGE